jgi:hypothetical protein
LDLPDVTDTVAVKAAPGARRPNPIPAQPAVAGTGGEDISDWV